ncbi:PREDICTED: B-cell receptor CD22 isoform X1 [Myotis brandtii]|uniref:B-cell receptor CD22 isoform X1 n=1 Tax=Myotis brandtii TaxID=109478 RepID=UPI000703F1D3|nr:PREDICTED: B-cell receptor CD22 isoform X1 [Myotis brandtii]XP_014392066.1 PREDICTED: B-cell receptor CD22 isoform X1 [Myotis brandtii]
MHLLGPLFLLLEYLAFSNSSTWNFAHPATLYAWEGACVWIPCRYTMPEDGMVLENLTVYQNYVYDNKTKDYSGTILYEKTKSQGRVKFLGDNKSNCTLRIHPVKVQDSGQLGLRMTSKNEKRMGMTSKSGKWMEEIVLNISKTAPPPRIELPPEIWESREVTLTCMLNFACFEYQIKLLWFLEELPQHPSVPLTSLTTKTIFTQSQLTLQPQWTDHGKNLTCQVWNDTADGPLSQETVRLDVKHSPKLKVSPKEANVTEDKPVTMTCQVISSYPEYQTLSWLKDGIPVTEQETLQREQKILKLTLPKVTKQMSGKYHCEARNDVGSATSEVVLQVHYAPEPSRVQIFSSPAKEGTSVKLICISQANPPPTNYTWYHDSNEVWRGTEETFEIPQVRLRHAGNYYCVAQNSIGRGHAHQNAELDVQYSPKEVTMVIQNPTPIREGDNVTLFCNYNSSNPSVTRYEWSPPGSWKELVPGVLMIQKVAWNAMPFTCAACNLWCSWAQPVSLQVQYAPRDVKVLWISPRSEIHSGHAVLLRCNFSSSRPTDVHFFWKKNGIFLKEGRELSFGSISPEDAGSYSCVVRNSIGQSTSEAWVLSVLYAPRRLRVSISPKDSVMEGKKAVLTCESDANPPISRYTWFDWNNQNLHHDHQTLRLDPVKVQHSGAYWCQGDNRLGVDRSPPSTLTVYYSPQTISRRVALGLGLCLVILFLAFLGVKFQGSWKRIQSQQGPQENSSGQSFFVRNNKIRRAPLPEGPQSLGCYNPVMEDSISYATLRFPVGETDTPRIGDAGTPEVHRPSLNRDNTVTYSVVQKRQVGDYENVIPDVPEDDGIHYSELVHLGLGERPLRQEGVEYVTLKH